MRRKEEKEEGEENGEEEGEISVSEVEKKSNRRGGAGDLLVRGLFERLTDVGGSIDADGGRVRVKPKAAKYFFKRWLQVEEEFGDDKHIERVKARAVDYVKKIANE